MNNEVDLTAISPKPWEGELTEAILNMIVAGLLIPNKSLSVRMAKELLKSLEP